MVDITPDNHPDFTEWLNNLGNRLKSQHKCIGKIKDFKKAIQLACQAVNIMPDDHPNLIGMLTNLGNKLSY